MGRHAASGSDGVDQGSVPSSGGRRRTDGAETPWSEAPEGLSDHPTAPGRSRADRRRDAILDPTGDPGRRPAPGRPSAEPRVSRPPLPPVRPVAIGPQTTMAPFPAVPAPHAETAQVPDRAADDLWAATGPSRNGSRPGSSRPGVPAPQPAAARPAVERRSVPPRPVEPRPVLARPDVRPAPARPSQLPPGPAHQAESFLAPPVVDEPAGTPWDGESAAPWSTGPAGRRVLPPAAAPIRSTASSAPPYGDWTKPSRSGSTGESAVAPVSSPGTTAIPERNVTSSPELDEERYPDRDERDDVADRHADAASAASGYADGGYGADEHGDRRDPDLRDRTDEPPPPRTDENPASVTGTFGGRAALRAERQAAEAARRKSGRKGSSSSGDEVAPRRSPRRVVTALVAVAVVALGVLGVYSFASPKARETASTGAAATQAPGPASGGDVNALSDLPPLSTGPVSPSVAPPAAPIRLPVTVLNETAVGGLAAKISGAFKAGGWPTTNVGAYGKKDIAATTVFFTQGDENARQAALQLIAQFPQVQGPTPRFFDVPGNASPGLVVVAAGEWKP